LSNPEWHNRANQVAETTFLLPNTSKVIGIQAINAKTAVKTNADIREAAEKCVAVDVGHISSDIKLSNKRLSKIAF